MRRGDNRKPASEALMRLRGAFAGVGLFSAAISVLMLTGSLYMLQVYDRVLTSRSVATLIGLSLIILAAFVVQGILDAVRARMLARIGAEFDQTAAPGLFEVMQRAQLRGARPEQSTQGLRDLDTVRGFLSGQGPTAFLDMPFAPIFFITCFLLHPILGLMAVCGGCIIFALALWTDHRTKEETLVATKAGAERNALVESSRRNAEVVQAMGMARTMGGRWRAANDRYVRANLDLADASGSIGAAAKAFRFAFQSAVLGVGAYLVILQQVTPGAMIAASILTSRALAPIETAVAHWKGFIAARQAFARLNDFLALHAADEPRTELPAPRHTFAIHDLVVAVPGRATPLVAGAEFSINAGQGLLLIGPSGSGKSTLMRVMASVWPSARGSVRLDGAALDQWNTDQLGRHIGYLPQDIELFEGTIAENIARFQTDASDAEIVAAAKAAGAHDLILHLPDGYNTRVGEAGQTLSGGQRQRVGLARALFRDPFVILLDEPNSNLDADGEKALIDALNGVRARGGIVIVVSHKAPLLGAVDFVGRIHEMRLQIITKDDYSKVLAARGGEMTSSKIPTDVSQQLAMLREVVTKAEAAKARSANKNTAASAPIHSSIERQEKRA